MSTRMVYVPNSSYCILKDCWTWDNSICTPLGTNFRNAIIWQAIPITGIFGAGFGAGFGNMGIWDLFGISSGIWGGGWLIFCTMSFWTCTHNSDPDGKYINTYLVILFLAIISYYTWGIIVIANREILGTNNCPLY